MKDTPAERSLDGLLLEVRLARSLPPPAMRRALRLRAGLTQQDVAYLLGVARVSVTRWESGEREPRRSEGARYAVLLGWISLELVARPEGGAPERDAERIHGQPTALGR
jgi:transcriptional regulator with XRE-family HTH domain